MVILQNLLKQNKYSCSQYIYCDALVGVQTKLGYRGSFLNTQCIKRPPLQWTMYGSAMYNVRLCPKSSSSGTMWQWDLVFLSFTSCKYPVVLEFQLQCLRYCCYVDLPSDWGAWSTGQARLLILCKLCSKCLVWLHLRHYTFCPLATFMIWKISTDAF